MPDASATANGKKLRILIVEDHGPTRIAMSRLIRQAGAEVTTARDGEEGLSLLLTQYFDVLLTDLRMPVMDGAGLWREVSARHPSLARRMLFVTGDTLSPDATEFFKRSGCDGLDKPFAKADLLAKVAALLQRRPASTGTRTP